MFRGIFPAVVTPFNEDGSIDFRSFETLCDYLANAGVHGLFVAGTTGEFALMSVEERKTLLERAIACVGDRLTVTVHAGHNALRPTIELIRHAREAGARGAGVISPYFYPYDDEALFRYYSAILDAVPDFPILVYNIPVRTGVNTSMPLMKRLRSHYMNLAGIKESGPFDNIEQWLTLQDGTFSVFCGNDDLEYESFRRGCRAIVAAFGNWMPHTFRKFVEAAESGDWDAARSLQERISQLVEPGKVTNQIATIKAGLKLRDLPGGHVRAPNRDLEPDEVNSLRQILDRLGFLEGQQ